MNKVLSARCYADCKMTASMLVPHIIQYPVVFVSEQIC